MKTVPLRSTFVALALVGVCAAPALAADNYVCRKVKDLKVPALIVPNPTPTAVVTYFAANSCELGKLTQICTPGVVNVSPVSEPYVAQCCFKAKCMEEIPQQMSVVDAGTGAPNFGPNQIMTSKKISQVCIACTYP